MFYIYDRTQLFDKCVGLTIQMGVFNVGILFGCTFNFKINSLHFINFMANLLGICFSIIVFKPNCVTGIAKVMHLNWSLQELRI